MLVGDQGKKSIPHQLSNNISEGLLNATFFEIICRLDSQPFWNPGHRQQSPCSTKIPQPLLDEFALLVGAALLRRSVTKRGKLLNPIVQVGPESNWPPLAKTKKHRRQKAKPLEKMRPDPPAFVIPYGYRSAFQIFTIIRSKHKYKKPCSISTCIPSPKDPARCLCSIFAGKLVGFPCT